MLVCCKVCHREYVASKKGSDEHFICSRCQGRSREQRYNRLGLHPALERKWANDNQELQKHTHGQSTFIGGNGHHGLKKENDLSNKRASLSDISSLPNIPGFEVSYQIGRGAMGNVYRARQIKTGRMVAIKVLACDLSERADLVARFEREAYVLKSLNNPNVVSIIDAGCVEDTHYFAMEFIDGITLRTRINRGPILIKEACFITSQILNGLNAAHKHGIIHRDLKPENVLLAYDGRDFSKMPVRVILVDFGLVGILGLSFDPHPNLTRSKVTMGTVNYMAPEQHVDAKRVDHRSDLYSAGVIFFEMLTKELPLGRYLLPHERGMDLPKNVDTILAKALSRKVDERYLSADHFLKELLSLGIEWESGNGDPTSIKPKTREKGVFLILRSGMYKFRYALLLIVAGLFFAFGIRMSKGYDKKSASAHAHEVK